MSKTAAAKAAILPPGKLPDSGSSRMRTVDCERLPRRDELLWLAEGLNGALMLGAEPVLEKLAVAKRDLGISAAGLARGGSGAVGACASRGIKEGLGAV